MYKLTFVSVILAQAGIHGLCKHLLSLDSRLRGNDNTYGLDDKAYRLNDEDYVLNECAHVWKGKS